MSPGPGVGGVGEVVPVPLIRTDWSASGLPFQNVYRVPTRTSGEHTKPPVIGVSDAPTLKMNR